MARDEIYLLDIWKMDDFIDCLSDFCILTLAACFTGYLYAQTACRFVCLGTDVWSYQPFYTFSLPLSTR